VLSWDAIIETLLEDDYLQKHGGTDDGAAAAHLVIMISSTGEIFVNPYVDSRCMVCLLKTTKPYKRLRIRTWLPCGYVAIAR